ncbi:MAG: tail fiber protein [Bacteroidota bacterium]
MSPLFLGQIIPWPSLEIPDGWMACEGQIISINQNTALFSLLGTIYGGDGRTTFQLPDLRGRMPIGYGTGPGLAAKNLGDTNGVEYVTLREAEMPPHSHTNEKQDMRNNIPFEVSKANATEVSPKGNYLAVAEQNIYSTDASNATLETGRTPAASLTVQSQQLYNTGGSQAHQNMQPYQVITFIIAVMGPYPTRS